MARKYHFQNYLVINVSGDTLYFALNVNGMKTVSIMSINYSQLTKTQLIQKIIAVEPEWKTDIGYLYSSTKKDLLEILNICLEERKEN